MSSRIARFYEKLYIWQMPRRYRFALSDSVFVVTVAKRDREI
ncbi:MAG: hypothetical protein WBB28_14525 [Crinalium sp.]